MGLLKSIDVRPIQQWKHLYADALIEELKPTGDVLQVGYGDGYVSEKIQSHHPKSHVIIESNPGLVQKAQEWAKAHSSVRVIDGHWLKAIGHLGGFDAIFYHDLSYENEAELILRLSPEIAGKASAQSQNLLQQLESKFASLKKKFTDTEIETFYKDVGQHHLSELPVFLRNLKDNGNITNQQFEAVLKKIHHHSTETPGKSAEVSRHKIEDKEEHFIQFIEACLRKHMHKGARLTSFLPSLRSNYQDPIFFERIISNSLVGYHEKSLKLHVKGLDNDEALIMLIHKS